MRFLFLIPLCATGFILGCTALTSELDEQGVVYYLPKTILDIAVTQMSDTNTGRVWYHIGAVDKDGVFQSKIDDKSVPDLNHRYVLHYRPSALSDDRLCITRSTQGLLNDVEFAADDKTPEVVFNVARFLAGVFTEAPTSLSVVKPASGNDGIEQRTYRSQIDPFNPKDEQAFNTNLRRVFGAPVKISFARMREMLESKADLWPQGCSVKDGNCPVRVGQQLCAPDHICYRTKLQMPVDLKLHNRTVDVDYAPIINTVDMGAISVKRAFLVHTITRLRFDDGALLGAAIRKPSEVEEVSLLPMHVLNAVLVTPTGLWAQAFSGQSDNTALLTQMTDLNTAVSDLAQNQRSTFAAIAPDDVPTHEKTRYEPKCTFNRGSGGPFNIVTNVAPQ